MAVSTAVSLVSGTLLSAQRWSLLRLQTLAQKIHPRHRKAPHLLTGERGEFEALFFLRRQGYTLVERRWRSPELNGDVDLIGWEGESLCFVEVKTRSVRDLTPAASAIDDGKRRMLRSMARAYRRTLPRQPDGPVPIRFDVVSVYLSGQSAECELVRAAFPLNPEPARNEASRYGV
jgi:putative endonuclease